MRAARNDKFGTDFTEQDLLPAFNATLAETEVRQAAVVNDEDNFGKVFDRVFADKVEDYVGIVTDLGKRYFAPDRGFQSSLNRSARRAAWRMIRREEGVDDAA